MKVAEQTISALSSVITGDGGLSPYRSGPELVTFFNEFCKSPDEYRQGFPSRWMYAEGKLRELNDSPELGDAILSAVDPRHFLGAKWKCGDAVEHLNQFLEYDGYVIRRQGRSWVVVEVADEAVSVQQLFDVSKGLTHEFISEQLAKSKEKLERGDYDGAITNARSLLEAVLVALEREYDADPPVYDGNLPRLYRRVQGHLNLTPGQEGLSQSLRQILSGLTSVVAGLAALRNSMSDSHVVTYRPSRHHALFAVNCARTMVQFLFDTNEYQRGKGGKLESTPDS